MCDSPDLCWWQKQIIPPHQKQLEYLCFCFCPFVVESKGQHFSLIVSAIVRKRSRLPGVIITQYVTSIPEGKSTPDFMCKLAPVTVEEGGRP